ncbi:MAG: YcxB family protein [Ruminococcaceae bacterium]|nr:YcxB family protein [Oscillospiraceae bacterium]
MEIRAKSKFNYDAIKALIYLSIYKKANPKKKFIVQTIIIAFLILVIAFEMIIFSDTDLILLLCLMVFLFLMQFFMYFILPRIRYNAMLKMKGIENEFVFMDDGVRISSKSEDYNGEGEIKYSMLFKVYETSDYFFLFQNKNQAFVVDKSTIESGYAGDIRNKLVSVLQNKYIVCRY